MEVVPTLAQQLRECYESESRQPNELRFDFVVGGSCYCPACGVLVLEKDGYVRCPQCARSMNEFIFALIERHFHIRK